jgi:pyochelin synthetase
LPAPHWEGLRERARQRGLTASGVVLAAYAAVLARWTRRPAFSLNLTLFNRLPLHPQVDLLLGDFSSVSLLAVRTRPGQTFADLAAGVTAEMFADLDHRLYSGVEVLRQLAQRRGREAALMPVVFTSAIGVSAGGSTGQPARRPYGYGITQTPQVFIDCQAADDTDGLAVYWDVREGIFPPGLVADMFAALAGLLSGLADGDARWDSVDPVWLPEWQLAERTAVNDTTAELPDSLLHDGILASAARTPDAIAVVHPGGSMTYAELVARATGVARALVAAGCGVGQHVAIVMDRGVEQVVAVLGTLLAGAVYIPVDTTQPPARRASLLAGVRPVLTQSWVSTTDLTDRTVIEVDTIAPAQDPPRVDRDPDAPAYVIYTSGSTGDPKGVVVSHRAALNTIVDINRRFDVTGQDRVLGLAQLGFDLSVYDIVGTLSAGATLVLPDANRPADPSHWADLIAGHGVTVWNSVPAQLRMLVGYLETEPTPVDSLRLAMLSGDWIPVTLPDQIRALAPDVRVVGLGGATEAAIWSIHHAIDRVDPAWPSIPYGTPLANQGWRVVDPSLRDLPVWVAGELCVTGAGLALGYLGDRELTDARFVVDPATGQRLYRTGDLGRYLPGGAIEFLGREDNQVKIRGHRVELGEIESALLAHPSVADAAVVVVGDPRGDRALLGFAVPASAGEEPQSGPWWERTESTVRAAADRALGPIDPDLAVRYRRQLDAASLDAMLTGLRAHGLFADGAEHTVPDILDAASVDPRHRWLVRRWLALLTEHDWLTVDPATGRYTAHRTDSVSWQDVADAGAGGLCTPEFVQYHQHHAELAGALLRNEQNPFELLFPQGRHDTALALYQDNAIVRHLNDAVAALCYRIAVAHNGPLRVLELGAGTGATTASIVPMLDGLDVDYLFTDLTEFFLTEARQRFGAHPWMRFARVDLDAPPRPQGLAPNSFDLVVCPGMLNSTGAVSDSLARVVELLAPGGWLVLTEPTTELPNIMLTQGFMMDPADNDREHGATTLYSLSRWRELLASVGAHEMLCLPEDGHPLATLGMHLLAARVKTDRRRADPAQLSAFLAERLPAHMVPAQLQVVDALPLTGNGKVDRATLASWRLTPVADEPTEAATDDPAQPADDLQSQIVAVWATALGLPTVGPEQNFFDIGGDSLIMARIAGRLREEVPSAAGFAFDTLLRQMLNEPTVAALARALRAAPPEGVESTDTVTGGHRSGGNGAGRGGGENALFVPFGGKGTGPTRVLFHAALGTLDYFQSLGNALARQDCGPVLGIAVADAERYCALDPAVLVGRVADDYAAALLAEGHQDYQLIGYCLGGLIAVEVAKRLLTAGVEVRDLTLVDSIPMLVPTDDELAFEAIFLPNLNLDPVAAVFGPDVVGTDVYRAVNLLIAEQGRVAAGALGAVGGDPGLDAVAAAVRARSAVPQPERLAGYASAAARQAGVPVAPELVPALFRVCRHSMIGSQISIAPYAGDIRFLRATEQQSFGITPGVSDQAVPFWEQVCLGEFTVVDIPGNHFSVMEPPHVNTVAEHLAAPLRDSRSQA